MIYKLELSHQLMQALWACIQQAPLPRQLTDELAVEFRRQVEDQNRAAEAEAKAGANGHDLAAPQ